VPGLSAPALFSSPERSSTSQQETHDSLWQCAAMKRVKLRVWNAWFSAAVPSGIRRAGIVNPCPPVPSTRNRIVASRI